MGLGTPDLPLGGLTAGNAVGAGGLGTGTYHDPLVGFYFTLSLLVPALRGGGGATEAVIPFSEISGLSTEIQVVETQSSGGALGGAFSGREYYKSPGTWKWEDITIKRPLDQSTIFADWAATVIEWGASAARIEQATISLYDNGGGMRASWMIIKAWPSKYTGSQVNASQGSEAVTEEITLVHEGLYMLTPYAQDPTNYRM